MTHVVAVVGTIAGAGTTTVVTTLGAALGEQRQRVALVDATQEGSRLTDAIDLSGGGELTDALRRGTAVGDVQASGPHDLAAFRAGADTSWGSVRPDAVADLYEQLRGRFDVILVDCGSTLSPAQSAWLGHADEAVIVTDPDVAGAVPETVALAGAFDVPVRGVLANRVPPKEVDDAVEALEATDERVLGVFPEDRTVGAAADAGASVLRTEPDSMIATCAWELGLRFGDTDPDEPVLPMTGPPSGIGTAATAEDDQRDDEDERDAGDGTAADAEDPQPSDGESDRAGTDDGATVAQAGQDQADAAVEAAPEADAESPAESGTSTGEPAESAAPEQAAEEGTDLETAEASTAGAPEATPESGGESGDDGSPADDPFTEPEARPTESPQDGSPQRTERAGEQTSTDRREPDSSTGRSPASTDEGGTNAGDAEPLDDLLDDVQDRVGEPDRQGVAHSDGADRRSGDGPDDERPPPGDAGSEAPGTTDTTGRNDTTGGDDATDEHDAAGGGDTTGGDGGAGEREVSGQNDATGDRQTAGATEEDEAAALSDEEIEAVFKETMTRVQERREQEEGGDASGD